MAQEDLDALAVRFAKEPMKKGKPDWSLNSRYLLCHLFFNILKEATPRNVPKGKLPSVDAEALEKMSTPIAAKLVQYRSNDKTLKSIQNAQTHVFPATAFGKTDGQDRAILRFNIIGFDNVERIFSVADRSIPINVDKRARNAFITTPDTVDTATVLANPKNKALFDAITTK